MDKKEFLERLKGALSGNISGNLVEENVRYYEEYINSQIRLGYPEKDVLEKLGEPRFLAKSIILANSHSDTRDKAYQDKMGYNEEYRSDSPYNELRLVRVPKWVAWLVFGLIIFLIIFVITTIVRVLIPIVLPILFIYFLIKLFRDWLN